MTGTITRLSVTLACLLPGAGAARGEEGGDLGTQLMLATVKVADPDATGTGFLLGRPTPGEAGKTQTLLVTAGHTLGAVKGDEVTVVFHKKLGTEGVYVKAPARVRVRQGGKALWAKSPDADVAVLPVTPPEGVVGTGVSVAKLATDDDLEKYEVHPGDAIRGVGFPHPNQFETGGGGFGVVRAGCVASFPLRPTARTKTFLVDLNTFEGDSGGPIYLVDDRRSLAGKPEPCRVGLILGVIVGQHMLDEEFKLTYGGGKFRHRMGLGIVVHASAVRRAVDLLGVP